MSVIQVGYPVDPDARQNLITDYNRVLKYAPLSYELLLTFCASIISLMLQIHVIEHTRSISIPTECYSDLPAEVFFMLPSALGAVTTVVFLKEFIHRLSILQDKSKSDLQVEIDIGCVAFLVSLFASLGCLSNFSLVPSLLYVE
jgi:hypothetical protein